MAEISISIENEYFGGDNNIIATFNIISCINWCIFMYLKRLKRFKMIQSSALRLILRLSKFKIFSDNPAFLKGPQISQKL